MITTARKVKFANPRHASRPSVRGVRTAGCRSVARDDAWLAKRIRIAAADASANLRHASRLFVLPPSLVVAASSVEKGDAQIAKKIKNAETARSANKDVV